MKKKSPYHKLLLRIKRIEKDMEQHLKWKQEDNRRISELEEKIK